MKVILFMAISANGYIARENGDEDFLSHANWKAFSQMVEKVGNFVIGRKTYEAVKGWDESYSFDDFTSATKVILSQKNFTPPQGYYDFPI